MATDFTGLSWYPWFPDLWMGSASVRRMSLEEREVYRELLDWQWQEKGYLPLDVAELSALLGFDLAKYPKALAMFPSCGTWKLGKRANAVLLRIWTRKNAKENGFEVYFLSEKASDPEAERLAEFENSSLEMEGKSAADEQAALILRTVLKP